MTYIGSIVHGFHTLLTGLRITGREIGGKAVTLRYPHEEPELSDAFRSVIQLVRFEETGSHDCVACMQCVKICPSVCITIEGGKVEGIKGKRATEFDIDFALCSLCGLCIDTCPTDTLEWSKIYDDAGPDREWVYDLLKPHEPFEEAYLTKRREKEAKEAAEKAAKREAAAKAKAEKAAREAAAEQDTPEKPDTTPEAES
jgi:formate hydrogenlyase subunit 6/NADH:ubiquinone oxidoreductase subunit I